MRWFKKSETLIIYQPFDKYVVVQRYYFRKKNTFREIFRAKKYLDKNLGLLYSIVAFDDLIRENGLKRPS